MANFITLGQQTGQIQLNQALVQTARDYLTALRAVQTHRVKLNSALVNMVTAKEVADALGIPAVKDAAGEEVPDASDGDAPKTADHQATVFKAEVAGCGGALDTASAAINQLLGMTGY